MRRTLRHLLLATPLLLGAACPGAAPAGLTDADRAAIAAVGDSFAARMSAGNVDGLVQLYTADAALMPPNAPMIRGRAAIKAFVGTFPPVKSIVLTTDTISGAGDLAYVRGRYVLTFVDSMIPVDSGKFLDVRRRQADGSWPYEVDMFSSDLAVPAPAPAAPARH